MRNLVNNHYKALNWLSALFVALLRRHDLVTSVRQSVQFNKFYQLMTDIYQLPHLLLPRGIGSRCRV